MWQKKRKGKRAPKKLPTIPAWGEVDKLLRATTKQRDRLILMLGAFCGCRVSEITKLQVPHLDFSRNILMVREGKGRKDRAIPIPTCLQGPLRGWIGSRRTGPVFQSRKGGSGLTTRAVQHLIKRVAVAAGFANAEEPRVWSPHKLRHAAASRWIENGASVVEARDLLGHSSIAVTDRYAHANPQRLADVVNR